MYLLSSIYLFIYFLFEIQRSYILTYDLCMFCITSCKVHHKHPSFESCIYSISVELTVILDFAFFVYTDFFLKVLQIFQIVLSINFLQSRYHKLNTS